MFITLYIEYMKLKKFVKAESEEWFISMESFSVNQLSLAWKQ